MAVGFSQIPNNLLVPLFYAEIDPSRAGGGLPNQRTLLLGQSSSLLTNIPRLVANAQQATALYGQHAMLTRMVEKYRQSDPFGEIWCLNMPDGVGAQAAAGTIAFTGTATAAGTLALCVAGRPVPVAVAVGMTAAQLATAVAAAISAAATMPVTVSASSATVTLTARHVGLAGNDIDLRLNYYGSAAGESTPAGITATITAMAGGTTDPDLTAVDTILADDEFDFIICPYSATPQLDAMKAMMSDTAGRWSYSRQVYGHVFSAKRGNTAALQTFGAGRNDPHVTVFGVYDSPTPPEEWVAATVGTMAQSLRADPARPVQTLPVLGVLVPPVGSRPTFSERQTLLSTGVALAAYQPDGSATIQRAVTTYQKNAQGVTDRSYLDTETLFTLMAVVRRLRSVITTKFGRSKLADNGTRFGPGQPIVTPNTIRAEMIAQYSELERDGLVENAEQFAANLVVERDANDTSRVNVLYPPNLINGLRVFAALVQFRS